MMGTFFEQMGFMRWPLLFSLVFVLALAGWSAWQLYRSDADPTQRTKAWVDAILFWGGFAFISGVLGTLIGVMVAAQFIEAAGAVEMSLLWGGIRIALSTSAAGALILALSALIWFVLQLRWRLMTADDAEAGAA